MDRSDVGYWVLVVIYLIATGIPAARILARTGHSRWWTLLYFIPLVNVVALWLLAYCRWPEVDGSGRPAAPVPSANS